ncbi:TPA: lactate utilization protein [Candidatus Micrarchaeota archaeon]|nr:lactate utilization protein [Candidatus Micrarchaeota archaeon]
MFALVRAIVGAASRAGELRDRVRRVREDALSHMEEYLRSFRECLEASGGCVHEAGTGADALRLLDRIVGESEAVKSKTSVGKEVGVRGTETDTGDFIAALLGDSGHPILPAIDKTPEEIAEALKKHYGIDVSPNPADIVSAVRNILRRKILSAGVGITGANVLTADGEIVVVENEGNIALVSHVPEVHVVVTSIEKVVSDVFAALHVCRALALFGTGQRFPTYVSIISGPSGTADIGGRLVRPAQGPGELHVVLVDNGRRALLGSEYRDVLRCINCGACISVCPVFHAVGKAYGLDHRGARGILLQRFQRSLGEIFEKAFYCAGCGLCREVCPAGVAPQDLEHVVGDDSEGLGNVVDVFKS